MRAWRNRRNGAENSSSLRQTTSSPQHGNAQQAHSSAQNGEPQPGATLNLARPSNTPRSGSNDRRPARAAPQPQTERSPATRTQPTPPGPQLGLMGRDMDQMRRHQVNRLAGRREQPADDRRAGQAGQRQGLNINNTVSGGSNGRRPGGEQQNRTARDPRNQPQAFGTPAANQAPSGRATTTDTVTFSGPMAHCPNSGFAVVSQEVSTDSI